MKTALLSGVLLLSLGFFCLPAYAANLVNINTATQAELETLDGIGPAKAQAIIDYRGGPNGPFETIEEIKEVSGIGDATFESIKDSITVSGETQIEEQEGESASENSPQNDSTASSSSASKTSTTGASVRIAAPTVAVAGATVEFQGVLTKGGEDAKYANYHWNFGDGAVGKGQKIGHTYLHPGKYVVVLSVDTDTAELETRMTIEMVSLELGLALESGGGLGVSNRSAREVDIGGWMLTGGEITFVIPPGTIVLAGETLHFSSETTGIVGTIDTRLLYPSGNVAVSAEFPQGEAQASATKAYVPQKQVSSDSTVSSEESSGVAIESFTQAQNGQEALIAAAGASNPTLPLWSYGLGLAALIILGAASTLFMQRTRLGTETKSVADEFEITDR